MRDVLVATAHGLVDPLRGVAVALDGCSVDDVAVAEDGWWAIAEARQLWRAGGGGRPQQAATLPDAATCVLPLAGHTLIGTEGAHLLRWDGHDVGCVTGFERVETRSSWHTPWGGPPAVRTVAAAADGTLYVNVHVGGILRSTDGGDSWQPTIDIDADVHEVAAVPGHPEAVVAATARGLAVSHNRGNTWSFTDAGLHAAYCRAVAATDDAVWLSASTGPSTDAAAVYRGDLTGGELVRCTAGLPEWLPANIDSRCLDAQGDAVALGSAHGEVYASTDAGVTWQLLVAGLGQVHAVALR